MYSMQQELLFSGLSCHLRSQTEVLDANEGFIWLRTTSSAVLLRETHACSLQHYFSYMSAEYFCKRERLEARAEALKAEAASEHYEAKSSKSARAYAKTYKPGPPVVPSLILSRILQYINKIVIRKRGEFVELVCRYWSLKREARRGAPLLRRLHLEPWTASAGGRVQTDEEKVAKLDVRATVWNRSRTVSCM
jgi:hypothetical protein